MKDGATGQPLVGANIMLVGTTLGAVTDANGQYFILNVPPGTYRVSGSIIGYTKLTQTNVRVRIDQTAVLDFVLTEETIQTEGVTVVGQKPKVELDLTASKESGEKDRFAPQYGGWQTEYAGNLSRWTTNQNAALQRYLQRESHIYGLMNPGMPGGY